MFISGCSFNRFLTCALKSFWGYMLSNRYARQHICAYSLLGRTCMLSIQFPLALIDNCGICGKRRFQTRAWWARQLRRITIHFIQLSNFRELDVVADYTVEQFAFWRDCHLGYRTIWTMCQKKQPPVSSILGEHQDNYISWNVLGWNPLLNAVPLSLW